MFARRAIILPLVVSVVATAFFVLKLDVTTRQPEFQDQDVCILGDGDKKICSISRACVLFSSGWSLNDFKNSSEVDKLPSECVAFVPGETVALTMYQAHVPHFAEGFFAFADFLIERKSGLNVLLNVIERHGSTFYWLDKMMDYVFPSWRLTMLPKKELYWNASKDSVARDWGMEKCQSSSFGLCFEKLWVRKNFRWFHSVRGSVQLRHHFARKLDLGFELRDICILNRKKNRKILNEEQVVKHFFSEVKVLFTEDIDFEKQVSLVSKCKLLISPHGAQMTNAVFLPVNATVLEFVPWGYHTFNYFSQMFGSAGVHAVQFQVDRSDSDITSLPCWQVEWSNFSSHQCHLNEYCHFCAKSASVNVNLGKYGQFLHDLAGSLLKIDCSSTKLRYSKVNSDVHINAWTHYTNDGEKEGRLWLGERCDVFFPALVI